MSPFSMRISDNFDNEDKIFKYISDEALVASYGFEGFFPMDC